MTCLVVSLTKAEFGFRLSGFKTSSDEKLLAVFLPGAAVFYKAEKT